MKNIYLDENEFPKYFYNALVDLEKKLPIHKNPKTKKPITPKELEIIFTKEVIKQEFSEDRFVKIDDKLREMFIFNLMRPRPLVRATGLEKKLNLNENVKIFYKREDLSSSGSHKSNTALAQIYYAVKENNNYITTETGAGQWGTAVSQISNLFGINAEIFMVNSDYKRKPSRRIMMKMFGSKLYPSPSNITKCGKKFKENKDGSLGIAISEAIERAIEKKGKYILGSVLNSVLLHQSVIGLETIKQLDKVDIIPTHVIGCFGGGSNFGGFMLPMYHEYQLKQKQKVDFFAVEPKEINKFKKGKYIFDYGDSAKMTPLLLMYSLGPEHMPPPIYAGGLRYHGAAPIISNLIKQKVVNAVSKTQKQIFDAGLLFAKAEGIIPAPESSHAIKQAIDEAKKANKKNKSANIVFNLSGHGLLDLYSYEKMFF